jgi:hypothetical protein
MASEAASGAVLRRVEWLTLAIGAAGAFYAAWRWGWKQGAGFALGAALAWLNFRWLKGSVLEFGRAALAQTGAEKVRVPTGAFLKFFGRFALLLAVLYVILTRTKFPGAAVVFGLLASAAAVVLGLLYELLKSGARQIVGGNPQG